MYESHFGFSDPPFQLNPDPAFYFNSRGHGRALAYLQYGVTQGEGFIVITGEIGAGKTTLVRTLLDGLDRQKVLAAQIVSTQLESGELLHAIITAFGIPAQGTSKAHLIATLEAFLTALAAQGRHALLIVDEAQNLDPRAVEELRMLSNFQLGNRALLQSFLVGQPELRRLLESPSMEQLRQRITASCHLGPLGLEETRSYIEHRLRRVGWTDRPSFAPGALEQTYRWSAGVPRRINRLCNRLLLASFLEGSDVITPELVEQTARELRIEIGEGSFEPLDLPEAALPVTPVQQVAAPAAQPSASSDSSPSNEPAPVMVLEAVAQVDVAADAQELVVLKHHAAVPAVELISAPTAAAVDAALEGVSGVLEIDRSAARELLIEESDIARVSEQLRQVPEKDSPPALDVVRVEKPVAHPRREVVLCVADTASAALKFAALAKALEAGVESPRMVLVNPGLDALVWPWERMERLLPSLEVGLHLGVMGGTLEAGASTVFERFGHVVSEFQPVAVMVLGSSDAVLACALLSRQRGVPLISLEAGDRSQQREVSPRLDANSAMIEQMSDLLYASRQPAALQTLRRQGVTAERVMSLSGLLEADAVGAVWREATTPYGAFMRHAMPIYLGPSWSEHEITGTPYAVVAVSVQVGETERALRLCELFAKVTALPKLVWMVDSVTRAVLKGVLDERPELAAQVCMVLGEGPRDAAERDHMDRAVVLCREISALPDQLSVLRGAQCALVEPGQVVADAAELLDLPYVYLDADKLSLRSRLQGVLAEYPLEPEPLNACVAQLAALAPAPGTELEIKQPQGAVTAVAKHLRVWLARRSLQDGVVSTPVAPQVATNEGPLQAPLAA